MDSCGSTASVSPCGPWWTTRRCWPCRPRAPDGCGSPACPSAPPFARRTAALLTGAGPLALAVMPAVVGTKLPVWIGGLHSLIVFGSLALLVWTSGQISLCHAAFVAVGVTTMSHMTHGLGLPWGVALLLSGLVAVPVGALVAIPALRLSGLYLALATLGFGVLMQFVFFPTSFLFGTALPVSAPPPTL